MGGSPDARSEELRHERVRIKDRRIVRCLEHAVGLTETTEPAVRTTTEPASASMPHAVLDTALEPLQHLVGLFLRDPPIRHRVVQTFGASLERGLAPRRARDGARALSLAPEPATGA